MGNRTISQSPEWVWWSRCVLRAISMLAGELARIGTNRARISIGGARCRKLSPGQGQRNGIRIAAESVSMRPMRNHEHRGCSRPLSNRERAPILARSIRGRASPTLLKPLRRLTLADTGDLSCFGDCQSFFLSSGRFVGLRQILEHPNRGNIRLDCRCCFAASRRGLLLVGMLFKFRQHRPLQPRSLSTPPLELGAHLHLQALREASLDPFISAVRCCSSY